MVKYDIIVIGGGAAGLMAAYGAAREGASVIVLEKMPLAKLETVLAFCFKFLIIFFLTLQKNWDLK